MGLARKKGRSLTYEGKMRRIPAHIVCYIKEHNQIPSQFDHFLGLNHHPG